MPLQVPDKAMMKKFAYTLHPTFYDSTDDSMRYPRWVLRFITFLAYAGMAFALLMIGINKNPCFVQSTYKQEFLAKVVANPFYSSSQIVKHGPKSMYEIKKQYSYPFKQHASDIGMFPIIHLDTTDHSAFWPVEDLPTQSLAAGGWVTLPAMDMKNGIYYYNQSSGNVTAKDIPLLQGTGSVLAEMALQSVNGPVKGGSVLPNLARCIKPIPDNPQLVNLEDWLFGLRRLVTNSHLCGTCLLTGQQATVDITSNYKTSLTIFSSVNMIFMLAVVLWISASFALFYVGGFPDAEKQVESDAEASSSAINSSCNNNCGCCATNSNIMNSSSDWFIFISILWNFALIVYAMIPSVQSNSNIPLNNVVMTIIACLAAIAVQWHWANYSGKEYVVKGQKNQTQKQQQQQLLLNGPQNQSMMVQDTKNSIHFPSFNTANFLSVASEKKYQQQKMASSSNNGGEYVSLKIINHGGGGGGIQKLGAPFAHPNYYRGIKVFFALKCRCIEMPGLTFFVALLLFLQDQMHLDTVKTLEYAITTPLMSAVLLASFSPTVPTGVVQLLFLLLLASHILCVPVTYLSNMYKRMQTSYTDQTNQGCMVMAIFLLLGICYILQINAISVKLIFFRQLWDSMYHVDSLLIAATVMMVSLQSLFLLSMLAQAIANVVDESKVAAAFDAGTIARFAIRAYTTINFVLKFVVGWLAFYTALNKAFPAYACGIWANV